MSAVGNAVASALLGHLLLALPLAVVIVVAVLRHRATRTPLTGLTRPILAGLGSGVFLLAFSVAFLVAVQMVDFQALPEFVETLALPIPLIVFLGMWFCLGLMLPTSPRTWTPSAAAAGGVCVGFASPFLLYCSYEVYRNHGQNGSADIFWIMQIAALVPWVAFPIVLVLVALGVWVRDRRQAMRPGATANRKLLPL